MLDIANDAQLDSLLELHAFVDALSVASVVVHVGPQSAHASGAMKRLLQKSSAQVGRVVSHLTPKHIFAGSPTVDVAFQKVRLHTLRLNAIHPSFFPQAEIPPLRRLSGAEKSSSSCHRHCMSHFLQQLKRLLS